MKWKTEYPDYQIITSSSSRSEVYSDEEIDLLIILKSLGFTDKVISNILNRSYWSVVYKWSDLQKQGNV